MPRTGAYVTGLEARFDSGRIVDVRAEQGAEAVSAELDTDEGARFLGEVRQAGDALEKELGTLQAPQLPQPPDQQ